MDTHIASTVPARTDGYTPPPSRFGTAGFQGLGTTSLMERTPVADDVPGLPEESTDPIPPSGLRPARAVSWRDFDDVLTWSENTEEETFDVPGPESIDQASLAKAALTVSLLGIVTGVGFLAGAIMGQVALRRMSRAGWFHSSHDAMRTAQKAVMIGSTGLGLVAAAGILVGAWWLIQTPLDSLVPGLAAAVSEDGVQ